MMRSRFAPGPCEVVLGLALAWPGPWVGPWADSLAGLHVHAWAGPWDGSIQKIAKRSVLSSSAGVGKSQHNLKNQLFFGRVAAATLVST